MLRYTSSIPRSLHTIVTTTTTTTTTTNNFRYISRNPYTNHLCFSSPHQSAYFSSSSSSLDDALSNFLNRHRKHKRQRSYYDLHKDIDTSTLQVTRLNDVVTSSRASLLDAAVGYAAGDAEREGGKRGRISMAWRELLGDSSDNGGLVPTQGAKAEMASAIRLFEEKEIGRKERLQQSLDVWRESKLGKKTSSSSSGSSTSKDAKKKKKKKWFITEWFSNLRERNKKTSPYRIMAEQLANEQELFDTLNSIIGRDVNIDGGGVDSSIIMDIIRGSDSITAAAAKSSSSEEKKDQKKKQYIYVLDFKGDMSASKVKNLSHEISAIQSLPPHLSPTEVVVRLKSPGGTVTGYGLASAELARLRQPSSSLSLENNNNDNDGKTSNKNPSSSSPSPSPKLTICVDEIATSGGYLMACVGHQILSSPFAAIGSIGVIASTPNISKRLHEEGIYVLQSTAGKYKRTVTPWTEPQKEEVEKLQQDVEAIHEHFKRQVLLYRADKIASGGYSDGDGNGNDDEEETFLNSVCTGEVWYGADAVQRGLVDDLITSEEYIQKKIGQGFEVLHVMKRSVLKNQFSLPWWGGGVQDGDDDFDAAFFGGGVGSGGGNDDWWRKGWSILQQKSKKMPNIRALNENVHLLLQDDNNNVEKTEISSFAASLSPHQKRALLEAILNSKDE